jgi:hypothetical protein
MRTYAEAVTPSSQSSPPQPKQGATKQPSAGHSLHQQITSIASQLGSAVNTAAPFQDVEMTMQEATPPQESQNQPQEPERQTLIEKIRQLEFSLASVPQGPECKHIRDAIVQQIEQAKGRINSAKPLAARLEGCQDALTRSQKRLTETESLVQLALAARDQASSQVAKYQAELAEVQTLIAKQAETAQGGTCLQKLHSQMQAVVAEMTSSAHLEHGETQNAMQQMGALFSQLTGLAAKAHMSAQAAALNPGVEQQRLQQLLIDNAVARPVNPVLPAISVPPTAHLAAPSTTMTMPTAAVGEPSTQVITGGG